MCEPFWLGPVNYIVCFMSSGSRKPWKNYKNNTKNNVRNNVLLVE